MYGEYVSVEERKEKARKIIVKLSKKQEIEPLEYNSNKKDKVWWAEMWENNMKEYADMQNRISRGRSYVKNGFVIDMKIKEGMIEALVMGSKSKPYNVDIRINKLSKINENKLIELTKGQITNLESFLNADFPKELEKALVDKEYGLFPTSKEIHFDCSCPDGADMCKHVAAVLFGISSKLTQNPLLFFTLRGIDVDKLIKSTMDEKLDDMLKNASKKSTKTVSKKATADLFDI